MGIRLFGARAGNCSRYYFFSVSRPALSLGAGAVWTLSFYAQFSYSEKLPGIKVALGTSSDVLWFRKCGIE